MTAIKTGAIGTPLGVTRVVGATTPQAIRQGGN